MSDPMEMVCRDFVENVGDYLEGALGLADLQSLETHLEACPHCALYLEQVLQARELTAELRRDGVPAELRAGLGKLFAQWKRDRTGMPEAGDGRGPFDGAVPRAS